MTKTLSYHDAMRYNRHIVLPRVDLNGQEALLNATVVIIGMGGLGSAAATSLCASGVGNLVLIDFDTVDNTNLPRQTLFSEQDIGANKAAAAKKRLHALNSTCHINIIEKPFIDEDADLIESAHVVLDCTDNIDAKDTINTVCFKHNTALVTGSAIRFEGQIFVGLPGKSKCYGCLRQLFQSPELSCTEAGIFSPVVNIIGTYQAMLAMQIIMGVGDIPLNTLLTFDGLTHDWHRWALPNTPGCKHCDNN